MQRLSTVKDMSMARTPQHQVTRNKLHNFRPGTAMALQRTQQVVEEDKCRKRQTSADLVPKLDLSKA